MLKSPTECLHEGSAILHPILRSYGFEFQLGPSGPSSGGPFASGAYVFADRKLELHFRHSLGLVTYHYGDLSLDHSSYMRSVLGSSGGNHYPGFSLEHLASFEDLRFDLEHFASAFLIGDKEEFSRCVNDANEWKGKQGFSRLS
jgi:hypothetical protein